MRMKTTTALLLAGLLLGGSQAGNLTKQALTLTTPIVAQAATTKDALSGTIGTATWQVSSDGNLTLSNGTLPSTTVQTSPLRAIVDQLAADPTNITVTQVTIGEQVKAPASAHYLFADLPTVTQFNHLTNLDVSDVTDMSGMFANNPGVTTMAITGWDTRNVTSMDAMFNSNSALETVKLGRLETPKLTRMQIMFALDSHLTDLDLSGLDTAGVTNNYMMLSNDYNLENLNLGNWQGTGSTSYLMGYTQISNLHQLTLSPQIKLTKGTFFNLDTTHYPLLDTEIYTGKWENVQDKYVPAGTPGKRAYTTSELEALYDGTHTDELSGNETYQWEPLLTPEKENGAAVTVHYQDQDGKTIKEDDQLTGKLDETFTVEAPTIDGYTLQDTQGVTSGTYTTEPQSVTFVYHKDADESSNSSSSSSATTPSGDTNSGGGSSTTGSSSAESSSSLESSGSANLVQPKMSVTAVKKIGFYRTATFSAKNRLKWFPKQTRTKRPQFVVVKTAYSKKGLLRYQVKDVNKGSKTYGKRGYITTQQAYVKGTYATTKPKAIKVVKGLNGYRDVKLSRKQTHYRQGQRLAVKKLVRHNLTTRYLLKNGQYVSANLNFSQAVK
ncbi:MucBP domain-containing protein [Levilactobacillus namurensis]|uniref:MucBP domain-containing protein n=1 Tax=Levilactobacillus namurensis TaxID=380393 RepID=UPI0026EA2652|nr:MucBP domain-containing protein [Levilactobacillus namurensis]